MAALSSAIASAAKPFPCPLQRRSRRHVRGHRRRVCANRIFVGRRGWRDRKGSCGDGPHRSDGGGRQQRRRNAALEHRRCAGWWELCVRGVLDGGSCAGRWRWSLEKMKAGRRWWSSQRNRRRCRCTMKKLGFFNLTKGYCLGYSKLRHIIPLLPRVGAWPRPIVSLLDEGLSCSPLELWIWWSLFKKAFWKFPLDIKIACYLDVKVHFSSSWKDEESWIQA